MTFRPTPQWLDCSPLLEKDRRVEGGDDFGVVHEEFLQAARLAFQRAADGPQKDAARWHFSLAEAAGMNRNEVDWLLEIHRAIHALGVKPPHSRE